MAHLIGSNGHSKVEQALPAITLSFNQELQAVQLDFKPEEFRSWDFVIAVLEMAKLTAQTRRANAIAMVQHQAMQQAVQDQAIARQILGK